MYLLDTSAVLAHCLSEPGCEEVEFMMTSRKAYVAAVTWLELRVRIQDSPSAIALIRIYERAVAGTVEIDAKIAGEAYGIKCAAGERLPAMDSLIAAAAKSRGFTLVHRDRHFLSIPSDLLKQEMLPLER